MERMKTRLKRVFLFMLSALMLFTSLPLSVFAKVNYNYDDLTDNKSEIVNKLTSVKPAKPEDGKTAEDLIKNPDQPAIYTLRTDFKVQRGEKYRVDYQPYIASVGEAASQAEKDKVNKTMDLPDIAGYDKPQKDFKIDYKTIKDAADRKNKEGNEVNGLRYSDKKEFNYDAKSNKIKIKHVFQKLDDFTKYTNPDGSVGDETALIITQSGNTGSTMQASPLSESDPRRKGFIPEADYINLQVPQNAENFVLEYRYNRVHYDVIFDTAGGTSIPTRTLYYGQAMPKIADADIPTKVGGEFQGWKPSVDLNTSDGKTFKANEIIKVATGEAIKNLDANLIMPASEVTFTAVWKDKEKADYAVQFWAEKADHAEGASLIDKYDYMGTRVYKDKDTGMRPDLDKEPVKGLKFPDLDQKRLNNIWNGARFNRGKDLYLNKFYVYNKDLTHEQNVDPTNVNLVKSVSATGKTVYNIYYDRQVYDLYFTKSNAQPEKNTFYPTIYGRDQKKNELVKLGGPGNLYHYKARFNEIMYKWPNDAMQTKGFDEGYQSFGWGPNYAKANWPVHLDTPPYRLNADEFLDMAGYDTRGGYTKHIDKGDGTNIDLEQLDFTTLSFGIKQEKPSIPHHMDFWMDGFKDGETIIRYDLVRTKADTADPQYTHRYPKITGFTPYAKFIKEENQEDGRVNSDRIDELNDEREEITPYPGNGEAYYNIFGFNSHVGELKFIPAFFSNADEFGDPLDGEESGFKENGYLQFHYKRNKYPLRFNYDPSIIRDDSYFKPTNQLDTYYQFPLKALSPDVDSNDEYKKVGTKEGPKNLIDNPENLQKLGLEDLVFKDQKDGKLKVKRPEGLSDQMVFKGWALDPAGTKLIWENPKETMPFHPLNLYAKWGEPDYQWKVTFDPNGGNLSSIDEAKVTQKRKTIQVGDKGQEEIKTFAHKEANEGDKQIFTVIQRQKLVEPPKPTRKGYDFMGWEAIRYTKDANGDYTNEIDNSYRETYKVPELYSFGNDVVSPIYLKAIWTPNNRVDVKVVHHILNLDLSKETKKITETLSSKRAGNLVATSGDKQNEKYILATHKDLEKKLTGDLKKLYEEYNGRVKANNTFFQTFKVEPEKIPDPEDSGKTIDNPKFKDNVFHFFYRPFRTRDYKVNYIDERGKAEVEKFFTDLKLTDTSGLKDDALLKANEENKEKFEAKRTDFEKLIKEYQIVDPEAVSNGNRHYDARNYRQIPGWVLAKDEKPQQQLVFDVNEGTNEFLGINGTGADQVFFYYKDVRVIEVPGDKEPPKGYVRVTFKADKGGAFTDKDGNSKTELYYDVIKGLKSDLLPVPEELKDGEEKVADKYYITPETGKKFIKWDKSPLLNDNTIINKNHTFTAYFEWSGLSASGIVRTEAFKDKNNTWTNDFAPKIADLKKQLVWMEKGGEKPLPTGAKIQLYDEAGTKLTKDDQVYDLVKEIGKADNEELIRTVNIKAKVTFTDGKDPQELTIPITVYKNVYEALNKEGDKPLFLKEAEGKEAKDGGLKDILKDNTENRYIKVTIKPNKDFDNKDDKVYYVNPNAWVEIPEVKTDGDSNFTNWTADIVGQNDDGKENGKFDFAKRHKFTKDTIITPVGAGNVVEQTDPNKKPPVPDSYVKVIVKTTDKATEEFEKTFWVNPTKEVTIPVTNPTGKTDQEVDIPKLGKKKVNYVFNEWQKVKAGEKDDSLTDVTPEKIDLSSHKYTDKVTVIEAAYKKSIQAENIKDPLKTTKLDTPQGKEITNDDLIKQITPQEGKEIESITVIEKPDPNTPGKQEAKVIVKYKDGSTQGTNDNPVIIPVEVHKNIIPAGPNGEKPEGALDNYVKVIFKAGTGGKLEGTLTGNFIYYVSPEVEVDMTKVAESIKKTPDTGYFVNGEKWNNKDNKALKGTFTDDETVFEFVFDKSKDIVEKTDDPNQVIPKGYVKVTFKTEDENKGKLEGDVKEKIYYVNPKADIKLKVLGENETATEKQLAVPKPKANTNFTFKEWQENIDEKTSITSERVHVAIFQSGKVTLTYNANGATGTVPPEVSVDHGTRVRLASAAGLTKKDARFAGWKIGKDIYQAGDLVTLEESKTAVAQWTKDENIIPYDPSDPITRPDDTYVRVTFETDEGLSLTESKAYYVKKNANIKLEQLTKPAYEEKTGYTFDKWDKEDTLVITEDIVVKAKANPIPDTIEKKDGVDKPKGYVEVDFTAGINGSLEEDKVYYVNPSKYVTLVPPTPIGDTGYEFSSWDINPEVPRVYTDPFTTITANFTPIDAVSITPKPGYIKVDFVIEGKGGQIAKGETTTYYVDPNRKVTLNAPTTVADTGYEFNTWTPDPKASQAYNKTTTIKGTFTELAPIIPSTDNQGKPNPKPDGYVTVTFDKGEHGTKIEGQTVYYVNPKANKTLGDLTRPTVEEEIGYKFTKWDKLDSKVISEDLTVKAIYDKIPDIIPKDKPNGGENDKPEGYITVSFSAEQNGKLKGTSIYYIRPNTAVVLKGVAPDVIPNTGFDFANWDTQIEKKIEYSDGDVIKALYNAKDNVIPQKNTDGSDKPEGYFTVTFDKGEHGTLTGQTVYYVKPNVEVTVPAPSVEAKVGYDFKDWDKNLTQTFTKDETITAKYNSKDDIIPQNNTDGSDKPEGYKTVKFVGVNGKLEGTLVYYVNPEKVVDLTDKVNALTKTPDFAYTEVGGTWNPTEFNKKFTEDLTTFTFTFVRLQNVIPKNNPDGSTNKQPDGYVKVTLIPTDKATDATKENKVYFVNPKEQITIPSTDPVGREITDANNNTYTFLFKEWAVTRGTITPSWGPGIEINGKFNQDTDITAKYNVKAEKLTNGPIPKDNVVTGKGDVPNPNDLIKNIFDPNDPNNKDNLPEGTTFTYTKDGTPNVNNPGEARAEIEVYYPDGKTSVVKVPIKVVDHVVPQIGGENGQKPLVPDSYVKITVDTTDNATPNTKFTKVFWVKPNVEVKIPDILAPTGIVVVEAGVTKTNKFLKWVSDDNNKEYTDTIKDTFTKETKITATYEFDKNVEPVGKNDQWIPQGSNPSPKDFIENPYDDNDPNNPNNLPPGTKFEFVPGTEPNTNDPGTNKETKIKITYPNGETREVEVKYNVTGDVVEQPDPNDPNTKPAVPDNFVEVIVKTTDKATEDITKVFWVNPEKVVTIPVTKPDGKKVDKTETSPDIQYVFKEWKSEEDTVRTWAESISGQFTAKVTTITAQYVENIGQPGIVDAGMYYTSESLSGVNNYLPSEDELKALVKSQVQGDIEEVSILTNDFDSEVYDKLKENGKLDREEISRTETIKAKITFVNGSTKEIDIPIVVYKNIYEGLTNGAKPQYVVQAEDDLKKSNPGRDDSDYVRVTLIPTAKAKNQQRKTYYVRKNASVIIPEIKAEGRDAYKFIYWKAEKPGKGQDNPNYGWATRSMSMFRSAATAAKNDLVDNNEKVNFDGRMSFDQDTDIVAQYKTTTPTPTPDEPDKPNPDYPKYPEYRPNYSGGSTIYIEKPVEKVIKVPDNAFVKEVRYMQGFEGKFRPFDGLTRAEAAQILANALKEDGYKYDPNYKISYKDIGNAWYTEAVKIVTQANVFKGYDDGNFKPQEKITRAEWIGTLKRFQELRDLSGNHMNLREGHWAMAEIEAAYQAGWLAIYSDGLADFKADEFIPRQEVAAVSNKAFERVLDKTYIKRNDKALVNYKDINDKMWSYEDILCASNTFLHDKKLYRAHGIDMNNEIFNINLDGFTITKDKFQRIER